MVAPAKVEPYLLADEDREMNSSFEIDILNFHGQALDFHFEIPGHEASWLLEDSNDSNASLRVDPDSTFEVELRAQLVGSTVHLSGFMEGAFHFLCGRCMEWRQLELDEEVQFVLMSRPSWEETYGEEEISLSEEDLDVSYYDGEIIDLRPLIREAVLLELPTFPACAEEERERCDKAYNKKVGEEILEKNEENSIDLRWAKLRDISLKQNEDS